jgi:hypothetical protein
MKEGLASVSGGCVSTCPSPSRVMGAEGCVFVGQGCGRGGGVSHAASICVGCVGVLSGTRVPAPR